MMLKQLRQTKEKIHNFIYYSKFKFSPHRYAKHFDKNKYPHQLITKQEVMINEHTGFPIEYQKNKVFNLKLAAKQINKLVIAPNEVFSFWYGLKDAQKETKYKDGLCIVKGKMAFVEGGGLCQLSNLLFYLFLNGPFKIIERHGHEIREFDDPNALIKGIDATVAEGYLDLKVKNESNYPIQINIEFTDDQIIGSLDIQKPLDIGYCIINKNLSYPSVDNEQFEIVDIYRQVKNKKQLIKEEKLYTNVTKILYEI